MNKITRITLTAAVMIMFFASCSKELSYEVFNGTDSVGNPGGGNGPNATLIGDWKFLAMDAKTMIDIQSKDPNFNTRSVSTSEYSTFNNKGILTFTSSKMTFKDVEYSANFTVKALIYFDNVLEDSIELTNSASSPKATSVADYKLIGADSINFTSGGFASTPSTITQPITQTGAKYTIEGNRLYIFTKIYSKSDGTDPSGSPVNTTVKAESKLTFEKL